MNSTRADEPALTSQSETDARRRAESSRHVDGVSVDDDDGGSSGKGSPSYGEGIFEEPTTTTTDGTTAERANRQTWRTASEICSKFLGLVPVRTLTEAVL